MLAVMKWTEPSAKTWFAPPAWKLYTSLLLVQLVWHGPGRVVAVGRVKPWMMYSLSWSAQPPSVCPSAVVSLPGLPPVRPAGVLGQDQTCSTCRRGSRGSRRLRSLAGCRCG